MAEMDPNEVYFDILDFTFEGGEEGSKTLSNTKGGGVSVSPSSLESWNPEPDVSRENRGGFPVVVEEELEWLLDKDAFPTVESCFGILSDNPELVANHLSPVSVLENSSSSSNNSNTNSNGNGSTVASCCGSFKIPTNHPVGSRSKKRTRKRSSYGQFPSQHFIRVNQLNAKIKQESPILLPPTTRGAGMGRRCFHCQADKTPQWRAGPMGPKTLCNACGVRYKSGRLLPEYRPASSPTFSGLLHSNSHRKVVEMRRQNLTGEGIPGSGARMDIG
ncbi:GATA transcription factor 1-like [Primulina eburnea]|uniref:GATA transcription factor 1-like n=1 Tax=Primulina eburnea TaxID=1245227 RepID=UPI003C6C9124